MRILAGFFLMALVHTHAWASNPTCADSLRAHLSQLRESIASKRAKANALPDLIAEIRKADLDYLDQQAARAREAIRKINDEKAVFITKKSQIEGRHEKAKGHTLLAKNRNKLGAELSAFNRIFGFSFNKERQRKIERWAAKERRPARFAQREAQWAKELKRIKLLIAEADSRLDPQNRTLESFDKAKAKVDESSRVKAEEIRESLILEAARLERDLSQSARLHVRQWLRANLQAMAMIDESRQALKAVFCEGNECALRLEPAIEAVQEARKAVNHAEIGNAAESVVEAVSTLAGLTDSSADELASAGSSILNTLVKPAVRESNSANTALKNRLNSLESKLLALKELKKKNGLDASADAVASRTRIGASDEAADEDAVSADDWDFLLDITGFDSALTDAMFGISNAISLRKLSNHLESVAENLGKTRDRLEDLNRRASHAITQLDEKEKVIFDAEIKRVLLELGESGL